DYYCCSYAGRYTLLF
nr:immunoglobulin light chain junction region [Macaca mulatta]MOW02855.1 immunoglobulin light chain junction region [Macaca mulatta]MOW02942.1 immunoglobulin light chain junction region [Macaca mulatta]MOW02981.1 immunoglobulin light chain junction region [Macaca mulatta]MOW03340.1 immunoglobulin light chain junction region [Macaca mulatta]